MNQTKLAGALAGALLLFGAAGWPAYAATAGAGATNTTFTVTTSSHTTYHDTQVQVNNYNTRVLGLATWTGPGACNPFTNETVYDQSFQLPQSAQEVQQAYRDAIDAGTERLDSTGGRGQIHYSDNVQSNSSSTQDVREDSRTSTETVSTTVTVGPGTIIVGDLDSGGTPFEVLTGTTNFDTHIHTEFDVNRTVTTTTTTDTLWTVTSELYSSPIVLDLGGSGRIQASNGNWRPHREFYSNHRVLFDFFGNGFPVAMEWVGPTDGLLVKPKANGAVDGSCLFGNASGYVNGYEQLASLDKNLDGQVSGKELAGLFVWQDRNSDAKCEPGELQSVQKLGITSLSLKHNNFKSTYTMKGKTQAMYDWWPTMFELKKIKRPI